MTQRHGVVPDRPCPRVDAPGRGGLNAPSGAGCSLTSSTSRRVRGGVRLNAPSGAGCSLTSPLPASSSGSSGLNAPSGAGCSLTPAPGRRVVATFPGAGSPPALRGPSGGGWNGSISTTFRWYDATRHRRPRERIRRRLWTRPCGKVAVKQGVPHHSSGDQDHKIGWPQPRGHPHRAPSSHQIPPAQTPSSSAGAVP